MGKKAQMRIQTQEAHYMMVKDPSQPSRLPLKCCDQCPFFTDSVKTKATANTEAISNSMVMDVEETQLELGFPCWIPVCRRFDPDSPFFASGNIERELLAKQVLSFFAFDYDFFRSRRKLDRKT